MEQFEVFINKDLKQYREHIRLRGEELGGRQLSDEEMVTAIKLYTQSLKIEECDHVAQEIGFDIDEAAELAINEFDSYQQNIRIELGNSRAVSKCSSFRFNKSNRGSQRQLL